MQKISTTPPCQRLRHPFSRGLPALGAALLLALCSPLCWGHGAIDERIVELTADLAENPNDAKLRFLLAEAYAQHEEWEPAMRSLARAEELAPGVFPADLVRGRILLGARRAEEAKAALDRFLAANPAQPQALVFRARSLALLKMDAECLADYRAALAAIRNPEPELFQEVSEALSTRDQMDEAVRVLADGVEKLGPIPSLVLNAMRLEVATGRFDAALSRVDAMQKSAPRPEPWMAKRAALLGQAGRTDEARAAWKALAAHLAALPNLERGSHSMSILAEQAQQALQRISSATTRTTLP